VHGSTRNLYTLEPLFIALSFLAEHLLSGREQNQYRVLAEDVNWQAVMDKAAHVGQRALLAPGEDNDDDDQWG
jgi:hypothetical protein